MEIKLDQPCNECQFMIIQVEPYCSLFRDWIEKGERVDGCSENLIVKITKEEK